MGETKPGWYIILKNGQFIECALFLSNGAFLVNGHLNHELLKDETLGPSINYLLRDAARYRWLRNLYQAFDPGTYNSPLPTGRVIASEDAFDELIDAEIAREKGDG